MAIATFDPPHLLMLLTGPDDSRVDFTTAFLSFNLQSLVSEPSPCGPQHDHNSEMTKALAATATAPAGPVIHTKSQRPPRARGRPRKVKPPPNSKGLPGLPTEIIGRIASFLLPTPIDASYGFAPPTELPYGHKTGIRQATKLYAHGGIPSGVRDVLRLARTCRQCDRAVSLVGGKIGDASGTREKRSAFLRPSTGLSIRADFIAFSTPTYLPRS
jgi:hypothetical protein